MTVNYHDDFIVLEHFTYPNPIDGMEQYLPVIQSLIDVGYMTDRYSFTERKLYYKSTLAGKAYLERIKTKYSYTL